MIVGMGQVEESSATLAIVITGDISDAPREFLADIIRMQVTSFANNRILFFSTFDLDHGLFCSRFSGPHSSQRYHASSDHLTSTDDVVTLSTHFHLKKKNSFHSFSPC
jgi:hypothetical protein